MSASPKPITEITEKYRVIAKIGRGAMADIHLAVATGPGGFNKLVVLKSLREELRGVEGFSELFMTEARLNAQLSHPHIVQTNEIFEFEGLPVIVMEYLEGQSLGMVSRAARRTGAAGGFDRSMHLRVLSDILHALDYAHNRRGLDGAPLGLVHCDASPQNVFLTYEGEVKLLDFGIARQIYARRGPAATRVMGKARYMPPEQLAGEGIDQRTDLYAVGAMAWEAAAGVRLWANATDDEILRAVAAREIPAPSTVASDVEPELERIVMRALEPDQEKRYPTALAMQRDLDDFLGISGTQLRSRDIGAAVTALFADRRRQVQAIVAEQLAQVAALPEDSATLRLVDLPELPTVPETSLPPPPARKRRLVPVLVVVALASLAGLAAASWTTRRAPPRGPASVGAEGAAEPAPSGGAPRAAGSSVELRVTAFPGGATITVDGAAAGSNPFLTSLRRSGATHRILVTAPGYEDAVRTVTMDRSVELVVALKPLPSTAPPLFGAPPDAAPPLASGSSRGAANDPSCDPPAYFDSKGLKHFKPNCL
jgi:hypothetical protein